MLSVIGVSPAQKILNKKMLKEIIKVSPDRIMLQDSSIFNPLNDGNYTPVTELPIGKPFTFVLPSEYDRRFFGTIQRTEKGVKVK